MGLENWLLFLGAGASAPDPCDLPPFGPLSGLILKSIGWDEIPQPKPEQPTDDPPVIRWRFKDEPHYPDIARLDTAAEVLFGTLSRFGVKFAKEVCRTFSDSNPNAVHEVAAHVLQAKGCVWTTNIDDAVERACAGIGLTPERTGRVLNRRSVPLLPLQSTTLGAYVKFHGTVEAPRSLAFTDRQLIAPLSETELETLSSLANGRTLVFYGYLGADADLADLLDRILLNSAKVYWFEPKRFNQGLISEAFPRARERIQFVPDPSYGGSDRDRFSVVGSTFLDLAQASGHVPDLELSHLLVDGEAEFLQLAGTIKKPSGATQARLVERFGESASDDDKSAWNKAWREDLLEARVGSLRQHLRHKINYSLYHDGTVAKVTSWLADHQNVLGRLRPKPVRNYFMTRACALLARTDDRDRDRLRTFVNWAVEARKDSKGRSFPSDLYYKAQTQRYALEPADARTTAEDAVKGLVRITDLERLAGALYEAGDAALYQADFNSALDYAFDLRFRRGRYAIARWQAWGAWLEIMARAHLKDVGEDLNKTIAAMQSRFDFERGVLNCADGRTAELLVARVRLAVQGSLELNSLEHPTDAARPRRYRDDFDLLRADIAIAQRRYDEALGRLVRVLDSPAVPVSELWARIGIAELKRINKPENAQLPDDGLSAADMFWNIAEEAHWRKAAWLEGQALLGVRLCRDSRADAGWERLKDIWPKNGGVAIEDVAATKEEPPRVLWMLTL